MLGIHSGLLTIVPTGLEPVTPDYESGATNQLSGALHSGNQRVMKPFRDYKPVLLTRLLTHFE